MNKSNPGNAGRASFDQRLHMALFRHDCPGADELAAYAWDELPAARKAAIALHLSECATCQLEQADFAAIRPRALAPVHVLDQAAGALKRLIAQLLPFDPAPQLALRGEADGPDAPIQRLYQINETGWNLVLTLQTRAQQYAISGQLLGPDEVQLAGSTVSLIDAGAPVGQADVDESGWFVLPCPHSGPFELLINVAGQEISVPAIAPTR